MTAATTVFALVPLAIGVGEGSESQAPLARAVVGGMTTATLITLVVIPVVYTGVHRAWPARRSYS
jgi:HAE1 family hydrophobic/amphiphilic exporter-1